MTRDGRVLANDLDDDGIGDNEHGGGRERIDERVECLKPCQVEPRVLEDVQAEAAVFVLTLEDVVRGHYRIDCVLKTQQQQKNLIIKF